MMDLPNATRRAKAAHPRITWQEARRRGREQLLRLRFPRVFGKLATYHEVDKVESSARAKRGPRKPTSDLWWARQQRNLVVSRRAKTLPDYRARGKRMMRVQRRRAGG